MPYLKGNIQDRITDLREQNGWSKAELAERIGIDASRIGRIESGETKNVGDDVILALAKAFGVSTDFLLGVSDDPEPNNYDIQDLGLSVEAAKNLYTEKIDPDVLKEALSRNVESLVREWFDELGYDVKAFKLSMTLKEK